MHFEAGVFVLSSKKYAYINPEMLKWARGETPFASISDVIDRRPKYTYEQVQAWENGDDRPSLTEAKDLAKLYDVPFACLFFTEVPSQKLRPFTDRRTAYTQRDNGLSLELWREIRRITSNREIALETEIDFVSDFDPLPVIARNESVASVARKIRDHFGIESPFKYKKQYGGNGFAYFRRIFENRGIMVAQITGVSTTEVRGVSIYNDVMPIVATNSRDYERAKVFTLFHEIAHLLRRSSSMCLIDFDERNDHEEKTCDRIAAETLLPEVSFRRIVSTMNRSISDWDYISLQKIGDKYAVSAAVVLRRLFELNMISYGLYVSEYEKMGEEVKAPARSERPFPVDYHYSYLSKQGHLFPRVMLSAYSNGLISFGEMCRSMNINSEHIRKIEQVVMF